MDKKISPSLMCANFLELGNELKQLELHGIEYLHIDIMDGVFVPNYTLGTDFIKKLHRASSIPLDIHLMIDRPDCKLDRFEFPFIMSPPPTFSAHSTLSARQALNPCWQSTPQLPFACWKSCCPISTRCSL